MSKHVPEALKRVAERFAARLPSRLDGLKASAQALPEGASLSEIEAVLHDLAGTAPTLGYPELGMSARRAEARTFAIRTQGAPPSAEQIDEIRSMVQALRDSAKPAEGSHA